MIFAIIVKMNLKPFGNNTFHIVGILFKDGKFFNLLPTLLYEKKIINRYFFLSCKNGLLAVFSSKYVGYRFFTKKIKHLF